MVVSTNFVLEVVPHVFSQFCDIGIAHHHNEVTVCTNGNVIPAGPQQLRCTEFEKAV